MQGVCFRRANEWQLVADLCCIILSGVCGPRSRVGGCRNCKARSCPAAGSQHGWADAPGPSRLSARGRGAEEPSQKQTSAFSVPIWVSLIGA